MAWYLWVDDNKVAANCSDLSTLSEKSAGFQAGKAAVAKNVNVALRQANLVACALMDVVDPEGTLAYTNSRIDIRNKLSSLNKHLYMHNVQFTAKHSAKDEYATVYVTFYNVSSVKYTQISDIIQALPPLFDDITTESTGAQYVFSAAGTYRNLSTTPAETVTISHLTIYYDKTGSIDVRTDKMIIYTKTASGVIHDDVDSFIDYVVQLF